MPKCHGKSRTGIQCQKKDCHDSIYCGLRAPQVPAEAAGPAIDASSGCGGNAADIEKCLGTTKNGRRCTNKPRLGSSKYCKRHDINAAQAPAKAGAAKCRGMTKSDEQCSYNARPGSQYCKRHAVQNPARDARARVATDADGRQYAENLAGRLEDIATGYRRGNAVLVVVKMGQLADECSELRAKVPSEPGNYIWTIRPPGGQHWVPVYCGMAGTSLKDRLKSYINVKSFGPKAEPAKHWPMVDAMSRGFSIQIRFRTTGLADVRQAEDKSLGAYNFALNAQKNGGARPIQLPGTRQMADYPIVHKDLAQHCETIRMQLAFE